MRGRKKMFELAIAAAIFLGCPLAIFVYVAIVNWHERMADQFTGYPLEQKDNWGSQDIDPRKQG